VTLDRFYEPFPTVEHHEQIVSICRRGGRLGSGWVVVRDAAALAATAPEAAAPNDA